jgi:cysteine-rich repeat protein
MSPHLHVRVRRQRSRSSTSFIKLWGILGALTHFAGAAWAEPVSARHVLPLGAVGTYPMGVVNTINYDFGHPFVRIDEVRIDWAGTIMPGICENGGSQFPCTTSFAAYLDDEDFNDWFVWVDGPTFDEDVPMPAFLGPSSTNVLQDGTGAIRIYLSSLIPGDGTTIVTPPIGALTRANLVFVGIGASATCGDGVLDAQEFCDDGNLTPGDGCSAVCGVENFFECTGEPSICTPSEVGILEVVERNTFDPELFRHPADLVVDPSGNVLVATEFTDQVVKVTPDNVASILLDASSPGPLGYLSNPKLLALDDFGNLFIGESSGNSSSDQVFKLDPDGAMSVVIDESGDGGANPLGTPQDMLVDDDGNLYVSGASGTGIVFKVAPDGTQEIVIGPSGDGVTELVVPEALELDSQENLYVADFYLNNIFRVTPEGSISVYLDSTGNGSGYPIYYPRSMVIGPDDTLYIADRDDVIAVHPSGAIYQVLGPEGDGSGHAYLGASGLALGPEGRLYVTGGSCDCVFEVDLPNGGDVRVIIDALGDGIGAILDGPVAIAVAEVGVVYVDGVYSDNLFKITLGYEPTAGPNVPALPSALIALLSVMLASSGWYIVSSQRTQRRLRRSGT